VRCAPGCSRTMNPEQQANLYASWLQQQQLMQASMYNEVCRIVRLSVCLSICLSACLPVCLSHCRSVSRAVCLPACLPLSLCLSLCLSVCLSAFSCPPARPPFAHRDHDALGRESRADATAPNLRFRKRRCSSSSSSWRRSSSSVKSLGACQLEEPNRLSLKSRNRKSLRLGTRHQAGLGKSGREKE
jgi:hypothetical protein